MARANHEGDASERRALPEPDTINQNQESNGKDSMGTTIAQEHQQSRPRNLNPFAWTCVVVSLLFSMFLFSLDNVIVADIQPSIISTLGNVDKLPWVSVGYALGATAVNLLVLAHASGLYTLTDLPIIVLDSSVCSTINTFSLQAS